MMMMMTLNFKIKKTNKQTNKLVLGPSCVPGFEFAPQLSSVEIAILFSLPIMLKENCLECTSGVIH